ncbi:30S ribosomal protein S6 [Candidatus Poribacteria bacterium]|nr:MAG: 30S ribosomal protein S6 [Candidatus Poribacteria bacterium]
MKHYELMLIITPDHEENEAEALIENVKGIIEQEATLIHTDVWGKRRLAYPIRKRTEGYYVVYVFECAPGFIAQISQALRVIEAILRHMIVLFEEDIEKLKEDPPETETTVVPELNTVEDTPESVELEQPDEDITLIEEISESDEDSTEPEEVSQESDEEATVSE